MVISINNQAIHKMLTQSCTVDAHYLKLQHLKQNKTIFEKY